MPNCIPSCATMSPHLKNPTMRYMRQIIFLALFFVFPPAAGLAADWPQYRGPDQTGATSEKTALGWPAKAEVLWKIPTPKRLQLVCRQRQ